jgi:hypothetical protein
VPLFGQIAFMVLPFVGAYFLIEANFDWRKAIEPTPQTMAAPDEKPARLRLCVNSDVPAYGNMQGLHWLREHKKEYFRAPVPLSEEDEEFNRAVDSADLDNPKVDLWHRACRGMFGIRETIGHPSCLRF